MADEESKKRQVKLEIQLDEAMAQGVYCNLAMINHTEGEFCLDFIFVQPQQPKAKVRARILASQTHAKRIAAALTQNVQRYEKKFGTIPAPQSGPEHGPMH